MTGMVMTNAMAEALQAGEASSKDKVEQRTFVSARGKGGNEMATRFVRR